MQGKVRRLVVGAAIGIWLAVGAVSALPAQSSSGGCDIGTMGGTPYVSYFDPNYYPGVGLVCISEVVNGVSWLMGCCFYAAQ